MVDTIKLYTGNFKIRNRNPLTVVPPKVDAYTGEEISGSILWVKDNGDPVVGERAYYNFNDNWHITIKGGRLYVQLSIPKYVSTNENIYGSGNLHPISKDQAQKALRRVQSESKARGITIDIENCQISRLDIFKNIRLDKPFEEYLPILSELTISKMEHKSYRTTSSWVNTRHSLNIYDKTEEIESRTQKIVRTEISKNIIRCEYQMKKADKVRKVLNIPSGYVYELWDVWDNLESILHQFLFNNLLYNQPDKLGPMSVPNISQSMTSYKNKVKGYWLNKFFQHLGLSRALALVGKDQLIKAIEKNGDNRTFVNRWIKKINEIPPQFYLESDNSDYSALYSELRKKLLDPPQRFGYLRNA